MNIDPIIDASSAKSLDHGDIVIIADWLAKSGCVKGKQERSALLAYLGIDQGAFAVDESSAPNVFSMNLVSHLSEVGDVEALCRLVNKLGRVSTAAKDAMNALKPKLGMLSSNTTGEKETEPMASELFEVKEGLGALLFLTQTKPTVKISVRFHKAALRMVLAQMRAQHCYKSLHDKYEGLREQFSAVDIPLHDLKKDPGNESLYRELYNLVCTENSSFRRIVADVLNTARNGITAEEYELFRMSDLADVQNRMTRILERATPGNANYEAKDADFLVHQLDIEQNRFAGLVTAVPPKLNEKLSSGAKDLPTPLETLLDTLKVIDEVWVDCISDTEQAKTFKQSILPLARVCEYFKDLTERHTALQIIDNELKPYEVNRNWEIDDLQYVWRRVSRFAKPLHEGQADDKNAVALGNAAEDLNAAFAENREEVPEAFQAFRELSVGMFKTVDEDLLSLCNRLTGIPEAEGPLEQLRQILEQAT